MTALQRITSARPTPVRFTAEEFMELAQHPPINDWAGKVELVEGEIVRMSPAHLPHWNVQRLAIMHLQAVYGAMGDEWVVGGEAAVRLGKLTVRVPDVAVLRSPDLTAMAADRSALFLAVEVADSSLRNDLGRKMRAYTAASIPHYWVVDIRGRQVHVMKEPVDSDYRSKQLIAFGDGVPVPGTDATVTFG